MEEHERGLSIIIRNTDDQNAFIVNVRGFSLHLKIVKKFILYLTQLNNDAMQYDQMYKKYNII